MGGKYRNWIALAVVLGLLYGLAFWAPSRGIVHKVSAPIFASLGSLVSAVKQPFRTLIKISQLARENKELEEENIQLKARLTKLEQLEQENQALRQALEFKSQNPEHHLLLAKVVGSAPEIYLDTLIIDRGSSDGVQEGQAVIAQGFLVGQITKVEPRTALVRPILAHNLLVPAQLVKSGGTGLLRGGLEGLSLEDIPLDVPVEEGEPVVTRDLGQVFPAGIPIGTVSEVQRKKGEIFQKITVRSPLVFSRLGWVFVILQKEK